MTDNHKTKTYTDKATRRRSSATMRNKQHLNAKDLAELRTTNDKVHFILSQLTPTELETAALACYEYIKDSDPALRQQYARRIVLRYVESKKGKTELALEKVRKTLKFRLDFGIEDLVTVFDSDLGLDEKDTLNPDSDSCSSSSCSIGTSASTVGPKERRSHVAEQLEHHLSSKQFFVQGYDREGRATLYFVPRNVRGHDSEWTVKEAIYSIERAIASTRSKDQTINAVVDFTGFSVAKHSPPLDIGKQFLTTLRSHYAGQIHQIYLVDTPLSFHILWKIFSPFVGTQTRDKIKFINGARSKQRDLATVYDIEQVPAWLIPGGKSNRPLDVDEYLHKLRFDEAFDGTEV